MWFLQSTDGEAITLNFESFDTEMHITSCYDWVEINDGSTSQRYCGPSSWDGNYYNGDGDNLGPSFPGHFTKIATNVTIKFHSINLHYGSRGGFLAVVCCSVMITTDVVGE